jgi:hypothetical protein
MPGAGWQFGRVKIPRFCGESADVSVTKKQKDPARIPKQTRISARCVKENLNKSRLFGGAKWPFV